MTVSRSLAIQADPGVGVFDVNPIGRSDVVVEAEKTDVPSRMCPHPDPTVPAELTPATIPSGTRWVVRAAPANR